MEQAPVANVIKHFCLRFTNFHAKLEWMLDWAGKAFQGQTP
jgi:hypothetical protein